MFKGYETRLEEVEEKSKMFPWEHARAYGCFLAQTWYYVCHSTRLLALAASRMPYAEKENYYRFICHISEERDHELLAEKDIANLGFSLSDFDELPCTRMFWETQYYKIEHINPITLMGYILALEELAARSGSYIAARIAEVHGSHCVNFLSVHGREDIKHIKEAVQLVQRQPQVILDDIIRNFEQSTAGYIWIMETIKLQYTPIVQTENSILRMDSEPKDGLRSCIN